MSKHEDITALVAGSKLRRPSAQAVADRLGRGKSLLMEAVWPGGTLPIKITVLTSAEREAARAAAYADVQKSGVDPMEAKPVPASLVAAESVRQILALAILDADTGGPLFASAADLKAAVTEDELDVLFYWYSQHRRDLDPDWKSLSEEEFREIDEAIKKKDASRLNAIASGMPRRSLLTLVDRLSSSLAASSGSTSDSSSPLSTPPTQEEAEPEAEEE